MAVTSLLHYALEVPDQTIGEKFYCNFGLAPASARDNAVHLRPAPLKRDSTLLYAGPRKRLHHLALGAPGDDFEQIKESLRRANVHEVDPPPNAPDNMRRGVVSFIPAEHDAVGNVGRGIEAEFRREPERRRRRGREIQNAVRV